MHRAVCLAKVPMPQTAESFMSDIAMAVLSYQERHIMAASTLPLA